MVQSAFFINCYQTGGGFNCETVKLSVLVRNSADWKNKIWSKVIYLKKIFLNIKKLVVKHLRFG